MLNNRVVKQAFMKPLLYFIPFLLVACQHNSSYTMKDSLFIGKLLPGDTLKIVNEKKEKVLEKKIENCMAFDGVQMRGVGTCHIYWRFPACTLLKRESQ
mgnify:CR=1 FL=1